MCPAPLNGCSVTVDTSVPLSEEKVLPFFELPRRRIGGQINPIITGTVGTGAFAAWLADVRDFFRERRK